MKLIARALVTAAASLALVITPGVAAQATAQTSFNITKITAGDIVVSSSKCYSTNVSITTTQTKVDEWYADVDINGRYGYDGSAWFDDMSGKKDRVTICADSSGLGKYTLGPSEIAAYYYGDEADDFDYGQVEREDGTKGAFYVRGKASASVSAKRSGGTVTLTSTTRRYDAETYSTVNYNPKVKFQVKSGKTWKTLKTVSAKKGKATFSVKDKSAKSYRVTFDQVSWATGATSGTVKK